MDQSHRLWMKNIFGTNGGPYNRLFLCNAVLLQLSLMIVWHSLTLDPFPDMIQYFIQAGGGL